MSASSVGEPLKASCSISSMPPWQCAATRAFTSMPANVVALVLIIRRRTAELTSILASVRAVAAVRPQASAMTARSACHRS